GPWRSPSGPFPCSPASSAWRPRPSAKAGGAVRNARSRLGCLLLGRRLLGSRLLRRSLLARGLLLGRPLGRARIDQRDRLLFRQVLGLHVLRNRRVGGAVGDVGAIAARHDLHLTAARRVRA